MSGKEFKPGQQAEVSGAYRVNHDQNHINPHEITMIKGNTFPPCPGCIGVKYTLIRETIHISSK